MNKVGKRFVLFIFTSSATDKSNYLATVRAKFGFQFIINFEQKRKCVPGVVAQASKKLFMDF